jgi:phasin family protein
MATKRRASHHPPPPLPTATSFFDVEALMKMQTRSIEAMVEANRIFVGAAPAIVHCQADMMRDWVEQISRAFTELSGRGEPGKSATKEGAAVQALFEKTADHVRDIAELVSRSNAEAFQLVSDRMRSHVEEADSPRSREKVAAE